MAACILLALYAVVLTRGWLDGHTLFGYRDLPRYDFSFFWAAGRLALAGKASAAYDRNTLDAVMRAAFGQSRFYAGPFFYPPVYFLLLAPLALLRLPIAAALWLAVTLAAYLLAIARILKGRTALLVAAAAPCVPLNFFVGQNGLLTAGFIGGALAILDEHPVAAGVLIGCLAYKPQFGLVFPVLLAATGRWRAFTAAAATVLLLAMIALAAFGWDAFAAFGRSMGVAGDAFFRHTPRYLRGAFLESVYGAMRAFGADGATAWAVHLPVAVAALAVTLWTALTRAPTALVKATAATAAFAITPYSQAVDLPILTVAMAFLVEDGLQRGFSRWDALGLGLAFLAPLLIFDLFGPLLVFGGVLRPGSLAPIMFGGLGPLTCGLLAGVIGSRLLIAPRPAEA